MSNSGALFQHLSHEDSEWVLEHAEEWVIEPGQSLLELGQRIDTIYFVEEGLLNVTAGDAGKQTVATLGSGEMIGEMSILEDIDSSVQVRASERSLVLALDKRVLTAKLDADAAFAARVFKAIALDLSARLRRGYRRNEADDLAVSSGPWRRIKPMLESFKKLLAETDRAAVENEDVVPEAMAAKVREQFKQFHQMLEHVANEVSQTNPRLREDLGILVQRELLPYLLLTKWGERAYAKPRGYAGDYLTIKMIYDNQAGGSGRLGPLIDRCLLDEPAGKAVRNRRRLISRAILRVVEQARADGRRQTMVTSLASGPAEEVFEAFAELDDKQALRATLIDFDLQALAYVKERCDALGLTSQIELRDENLIYVALGRRHAPFEAQDLVYSIGLIDYFGDRLVVQLLDVIWTMLRSGGETILGNFHPRNPTRALMDYVLDWKLIHRTEEDMARLFTSSRFRMPPTEIEFEEERINLFARCRRTE